MAVPFIYEIPILVILILLFYFVIQNFLTMRAISTSPLKKVHSWLIAAGIFFMVWGADHLYNDIVPLTENEELFFHYVVSHGGLLIAVICLAMAAKYIGDFGEEYGFGVEK